MARCGNRKGGERDDAFGGPLAGAVLCACSFCHALCDALRAVQCGGDPKGHAVRLQVSLCGALLLPTAAVIWAVYRMPAGL